MYVNNGYIERKAYSTKSTQSKAARRNWWLIKHHPQRKKGVVLFKGEVLFPEHLIGKKVRFRAELFEVGAPKPGRDLEMEWVMKHHEKIRILRFIASASEPISAKEVQEALKKDRYTCIAAFNALEEKEYISQAPNPDNHLGSLKYYSITDKGRFFLKRAEWVSIP